jgi:[ribosomal protein S18]-alanine N-acetyltransferase
MANYRMTLIRPATLADLASIISLERQCVSAAHWTEEQYRQALASAGGERLLFVAEASPPILPSPEPKADVDAEVLGFLVAAHIAPEWELENIAIAPAARQKGLGNLLLNALLSAARETNSDSVFLEVRQSNTAARTLYEKAGFEQTGHRKSYYTNPVEDAVLYRLTLN